LPDKDNYDFKSTSYGSEVYMLGLSDPYFGKNGLTSMEGVYTFAVYGKTRSTFILSANQGKYPIINLQEGLEVSNT